MLPHSFATALTSARENGQFTDFTLICEGREYAVHRIVLSCYSKVFAAAFRSGMKEATSGRYEMNEDDPFMVYRMVQYMYSGTYKDQPGMPNSEQQESASALQIHARMFMLADKYQIDELEIVAVERYKELLMSQRDVAAFLGSIPDVFKITLDSKRAIRTAAVHFARCHLGKAIQNHDSLKRKYDEMAMDVPDFPAELLDSYLNVPSLVCCILCNHTQSTELSKWRCKLCKKENNTRL
ncbi:BTB/POZ protein [Xylaria intraflava]|nr:BTB/POZ protein [Xylaria intraflava]